MVSKSIVFTFVLVASYALLLCEVQSYIFEANDDEKEICEKQAQENGKKLSSAKKLRPFSCQVFCKYDDGQTERVSSPDGQLCCQMGAAPTGCCSGGMCPPGFMTCDFGQMFGQS